MQHHGLAVRLFDEAGGGRFDRVPVPVERLAQIGLAQRSRAEAVFQRLSRNGTVHRDGIRHRNKS